MKKINENLEVEEKSFKKFSTIIIDMIEEEYQDSYQLINNWYKHTELWQMRMKHDSFLIKQCRKENSWFKIISWSFLKWYQDSIYQTLTMIDSLLSSYSRWWIII